MVYEYQHRISLFEVGAYLHRYIDDHATAPTNNAPINWSLEAHIKLLLMNEQQYVGRLRETLARVLPSEHAEYLTDTVHDLLVFHLRPFLALEEEETVVDAVVKTNYDAIIHVTEVDGCNAVAS